MKYVITSNSISLVLNGKSFVIGSDEKNYPAIKDALERGAIDYEIEYLFNPKDVDTAKKLLLNPLDKA